MHIGYCFVLLLLINSPLFSQNLDDFRFQDSFDSLKMKKRWYYEITENNQYFLTRDSMVNLNSHGRFKDGFLVSEMNSTGDSVKAKRAEIVTRLFDSIGMHKYLSLSIQAPESIIFDSSNFGRETLICQWHSRPAPGKDWDHYRKSNKYITPSIALYITTSDNIRFYLVLRYGNNGKPGFEEFGEVWSTIAVRKIELGEWYDLMFHIKWSDHNDGFIAAWINNEPFTPFNGLHNKVFGANMHNASPVTFKLGQYRYFDDTHKHQVFYDEFHVGENLEEVSLFDALPVHYDVTDELQFIEIHK